MFLRFGLHRKPYIHYESTPRKPSVPTPTNSESTTNVTFFAFRSLLNPGSCSPATVSSLRQSSEFQVECFELSAQSLRFRVRKPLTTKNKPLASLLFKIYLSFFNDAVFCIFPNNRLFCIQICSCLNATKRFIDEKGNRLFQLKQ